MALARQRTTRLVDRALNTEAAADLFATRPLHAVDDSTVRARAIDGWVQMDHHLGLTVELVADLVVDFMLNLVCMIECVVMRQGQMKVDEAPLARPPRSEPMNVEHLVAPN